MTDLAQLGIRIEAHGDRLRYSPRSAVTPDLGQRMKAHKGELLAMLRQGAKPQETEPPRNVAPILPVEDGTPAEARPERTEPQHGLIGHAPQHSPRPPVSILADPPVICPRCQSRRVLRELRSMTRGLCWDCSIVSTESPRMSANADQ